MRALKAFFIWLFLLAISATLTIAQSSAGATADPVLLKTLQQELNRAMTSLSKADPAPYFISYSVEEDSSQIIIASNGALVTTMNRHERTADVSVRVGSPQLDNTHGQNRFHATTTTSLPLDDKPDAIARVLWLATDRMYKTAAQTFLQVKTSTQVSAAEEDESPDFTQEKPQVSVGPFEAAPRFDEKAWENRIRHLSAIFNQYPEIETSTVVLEVEMPTHYFVSSEGSKIVTSQPLIRVLALGNTRADDGMELARSETFDASSFDKMASDEVMTAKVQKIAQDLRDLRAAPVVEPFSGPALLSGRAAAVFFHEVVGHRLEGQRQRGDDEGQTFTKMINQRVLPPFLSVVDDPTRASLSGVELSGHYAYDDEGQKSEKVDLITDGILKRFLMSRMPVKGFLHSNGHGRAQEGLMPVGRQGNLIVTSTKSVPDSELRAKFIEQIKKSGKPYGLYFEDIAGGFTLTLRNMPQAFQIMPLMVWKVFPDGRPDQLVRGVDIIGTPLNALNRIILTGQKMEVFNGECGAESGSVPVSASAPAMLFSEIEVQKVAQGHERPPVLPPPGFEKTATAAPAATTQGAR